MTTATRAGKWRVNLSGEAAYKSFLPSPLPPIPALKMDSEMWKLLVKAHRQLANLEVITERIPSVSLFVSMYVRKEALLSSQIEGTQATLEDVFDPFVDENANRNVIEVINYVKATQFAIDRLANLPLCNRLIKETHAVLMSGVRGQEKYPGEFRRSQNWIGGLGSTLSNARYIPPSIEDMAQAMSDLEKYFHTESDLDVLVRAALIHYQFETIHPFLDGNGRVGRLLITIFLMQKGFLSKPVLYISYFLKKNRIEYYDRLSEVRDKGNYEQWVKFFLRAVYETAKDAAEATDKMTLLHEKNAALVADFGRGTKTALRLLHYLEENPIIDIGKTALTLGMTFATISGAVNRLLGAGILSQVAGKARNRIFTYEAYLKILKNGT
jgi:Fic family protein